MLGLLDELFELFELFSSWILEGDGENGDIYIYTWEMEGREELEVWMLTVEVWKIEPRNGSGIRSWVCLFGRVNRFDRQIGSIGQRTRPKGSLMRWWLWWFAFSTGQSFPFLFVYFLVLFIFFYLLVLLNGWMNGELLFCH